MPFALLLAMQASGMIVDWLGMRNQAMLADMGSKLQQQGIEANIEQTRLEAEDATLQSLQKLRQTLGSQLAIFAARGTNPGAGSAFGILQESISNQGSDERTRRMNLLSKENSLRAGGTLAKLNSMGEKTKMWNSFSQRTLQRFPSTPDAWGKGFSEAGKAFGLTSLE